MTFRRNLPTSRVQIPEGPIALVAHPVERVAVNHKVAGSIPAWSVRDMYRKSIRNKRTRDGAEEARVAHNHEVAGSKPASAKKFFN